MTNRDFYNETKWCESCRTYVHFVMSVNHSYCVQCGSRVKLFNKDDSRRFETEVQKRRWKAV
mgnify:CR=1 FL=1